MPEQARDARTGACRPRGARRVGLVAAFSLALAGCSAIYTNHGYIPPEEELQAILPGVDTRESLETSVGRPSVTGVMRDEAWFYTAYRVRSFAYTAPRVVEREVVAVSFDDDGVVSNIERFELEDGEVVTLSRRVTESGIRDVTLLDQILRNFGRIDLGEVFDGQ